MTTYATEEWSDDEARVLTRYVTNLDGPVFALVNLPEVVKGALFARYSRSAKSLRRLLLDEFVSELGDHGHPSEQQGLDIAGAESLYERVFVEYGDDSVAQLGGVHVAVEQASNILTKVLEWGRLASYLEQSTRYIPYDNRLGGRYRYFRDPEILASPLGARYVGDLDVLFETYADLVAPTIDHFRSSIAKDPADSDFVYRQAIRAKAFDSLRGLLPAAALSNVGIYGSGQAFEGLLLRLRAHPLPEARMVGDAMLTELRKVIPAFVRRVDVPDRGGAWSRYLSETRDAIAAEAERLFPGQRAEETAPSVELVDFDPMGEDRMISAMLYPHTSWPERLIEERVATMSTADRLAVVRAYVGERTNRRHKPGRALEATSYRFDILADYGAFRDLQRHRMLTVEWQDLTPSHGYDLPAAVDATGHAPRYHHAMEVSAHLWEALAQRFPERAAYAVALAYRVRFVMQMNAREAMHLIELRSGPQGHPSYRRVAQEMHRLIAERAGHHAVAAMMEFVDTGTGPDLERLEAERRVEQRRNAAPVDAATSPRGAT